MKGALFKGSEELQLLLDSFLIAFADGLISPLCIRATCPSYPSFRRFSSNFFLKISSCFS